MGKVWLEIREDKLLYSILKINQSIRHSNLTDRYLWRFDEKSKLYLTLYED